jgi:twinkle protein
MRLIPDNFNFSEYESTPEKSRVIPAASLVDQVVDLMYGDASHSGAFMPWNKVADRVRFRPGEVSVYAGVNGNGKSLLTSQIALSLQSQGEKVLIASFEMRAKTTMKRMVTQAAGSAMPSIPWIRAFHAWTDDKLWLYDHYGHCAPEKCLAVLRYCADELKIKHLFVDSMMKVVADEDDYNGQKRFIGDLCALAQAWDVHLHVVHHAKKTAAETDRIDKMSLKGSGSIADQVDNLFLVQRNVTKEREVASGSALPDVPDAFLKTSKQRNGEYEGTIGLWYVPGAQVFTDRENVRAPHLVLDLLSREPGEEG